MLNKWVKMFISRKQKTDLLEIFFWLGKERLPCPTFFFSWLSFRFLTSILTFKNVGLYHFWIRDEHTFLADIVIKFFVYSCFFSLLWFPSACDYLSLRWGRGENAEKTYSKTQSYCIQWPILSVHFAFYCSVWCTHSYDIHGSVPRSHQKWNKLGSLLSRSLDWENFYIRKC